MQLERAYLIQLLVWGAASVVAGTAVWAILAVARARSRLLAHFGLQTLVWGGGEASFAAVRWQHLVLRDLAGATQLDRLLWFVSGLDVGVIAVGVALAVMARRVALGPVATDRTGAHDGAHDGALGAGLALIVQGAALLAMHAGFMARVSV